MMKKSQLLRILSQIDDEKEIIINADGYDCNNLYDINFGNYSNKAILFVKTKPPDKIGLRPTLKNGIGYK
jgi:hypothetical protein